MGDRVAFEPAKLLAGPKGLRVCSGFVPWLFRKTGVRAFACRSNGINGRRANGPAPSDSNRYFSRVRQLSPIRGPHRSPSHS